MRTIGLLALSSCLLGLNAAPAGACGDKLLMLGRGIRFQSRHTPRAASILLYLPTSAAGTSLTDPKLESALTEAGHKLRSVTTPQELADAVGTGKYDVVLVDVAQAGDLQQALAASATQPAILPAVYLLSREGQQTRPVDAQRAKNTFGAVLKVPGRAGHYCVAVDKAMELKLKRDRAKAPGS